MPFTQTLHSIQSRSKPSDTFYTPKEVVLKAIENCRELVDTINDHRVECCGEEPLQATWYDPFKGQGAFYERYPIEDKKDWAEITQGRDFYKTDPVWPREDIKIICSNPPYSHLDGVLKRCVQVDADIICLTVGLMNITRPRLCRMEGYGYRLMGMTMVDVKNWFGMSNILILVKMCGNEQSRGLLEPDDVRLEFMVRQDGRAYEYEPWLDHMELKVFRELKDRVSIIE